VVSIRSGPARQREPAVGQKRRGRQAGSRRALPPVREPRHLTRLPTLLLKEDEGLSSERRRHHHTTLVGRPDHHPTGESREAKRRSTAIRRPTSGVAVSWIPPP